MMVGSHLPMMNSGTPRQTWCSSHSPSLQAPTCAVCLANSTLKKGPPQSLCFLLPCPCCSQGYPSGCIELPPWRTVIFYGKQWRQLDVGLETAAVCIRGVECRPEYRCVRYTMIGSFAREATASVQTWIHRTVPTMQSCEVRGDFK